MIKPQQAWLKSFIFICSYFLFFIFLFLIKPATVFSCIWLSHTIVFLPVEHRSYNEIFKLDYTFLIPPPPPPPPLKLSPKTQKRSV